MVNELGTDTAHTSRAGTTVQLGPTPTPTGVNFALYSQHATEVSLLLCSTPHGRPTEVIALQGPTDGVWHVHVDGVAAGQLYGYRVGGPYEPAKGLRFNTVKVVLDPYAKAVTGKFGNTDNLLLTYDPQSGNADMTQDSRDSGPIVPKAIVVDDDAFDWAGDAPPALPLEQLVIYEVHAKGFTAHPSSGVQHPVPISASSRRSPTCRHSVSTPSSCCRCTNTTWTTSCCNAA